MYIHFLINLDFLDFNAKLATNLCKSFPKVHNLHDCRKLMQIRCQKGAGTKMHKIVLTASLCDAPHIKSLNKENDASAYML